jgi:ABC-type branched-subunit amino acid transport system permease subunit
MIGNDNLRKLTALVCIWAALLLAPYWMPPLGGYTALGTRVLILGLAAMSVNFLLGFTGVLSFGHAAYFGLGAYGAGLSLKFLCWAVSPGHCLGRSSCVGVASISPWSPSPSARCFITSPSNGAR